MKAVIYDRYGGPEVLQMAEVAEPVAARDELVVRVRAASINPLDWKLRTGQMGLLAGRKFPKRSGFDVAGIVESCGPDVTGLKPGDEVFGGTHPLDAHRGTFAEKCLTRAGLLALKPAGLSFVDAAASPCAGLSALQSLRHCKVGAGKRVLVIGATGGLGIFAVPLAKRLGAHVTAVCSSHGVGLVQQLGADVVIDRGQENPLAPGPAYDAILDLAAVHSFGACRHRLGPRGYYLNTMPGPGTIWSQCWTTLFSAKKARAFMLKPSSAGFRELGELMISGGLRPKVARVFPFTAEAVREMHRLSQDGHVLGKLVLERQ
ncbi:MAG: NAD(P)-dependent alcohol dehydrogenase [Lacunisphaera sp.]|nr:NAD(P)-dependent alcohol dehydrogenase [Lacunisphaera sp.]